MASLGMDCSAAQTQAILGFLTLRHQTLDIEGLYGPQSAPRAHRVARPTPARLIRRKPVAALAGLRRRMAQAR